MTAVTTIFMEWRTSVIDSIRDGYPDHEFDADLDSMRAEDLRRALDKVPGLEDLMALDNLIFTHLPEIAPLDNYDRRYLAEMRGWLVDAQRAASNVEFIKAWELIGQAHDRVTWMLYGRNRKPDRHPARVLDASAREALESARNELLLLRAKFWAGSEVVT